MGVVYNARQTTLGRTVALKMILVGAHAGPIQLARFRNEALATARLQHPNIVQIHAVGEQGGMPFLTLELIDGPSLAERLRLNTLPSKAAAALAEQLARALHYAHVQGIVHRDLKPANVMLSRSEAGAAGAICLSDAGDEQHFLPKITDFGLAKCLAPDSGGATALESTLTGDVLGTPHYMAPEQATGHREQVTPSVDVYCLGAVLYESLTGRPPFQGTSQLDTLRQVREQEPVSPRLLRPSVPRDLETICLKCLEKNPLRRYPDAGQLADDLRRFLNGRTILARRARMWEPFWKWARREKSKALSLCVAAVAAVLLTAGGWWSSVRLSSLADNLKQEATRADAAAREARHERDEAQRREEEAVRLRAETERQRQIADQNFLQARQLVDQFINRLADDPRLRQHGLDDVRKELLSASAAAYQSFVQQRNGDPEVLLAWSRANQRLARVTSQIALKKDALKLAQEAIAVLEKLADDRPQDVELQLELASTYIQLGGISIDLQPNRDYAVSCLEKALRIQETQAHAAPSDARIAQQLLFTLTGLGGVYRDQRRIELSQATLQKALLLAQQLSEQDPASEDYAQGLATAYLNLGFLYAVEERWQPSEETYRQSLAIYERLAWQRPTDMRVKSELAENRSWLANVLTYLNRHAEAFTLLDEARMYQESLLRRHAVATADMTKLATTYRYLGNVRRDTGYPEEAIECYGKAIALHESILKKEPQRDRTARFLAEALLDRAEILVQLGRSQEADADWRQALQCSRPIVWRSGILRAERLAREGNAKDAKKMMEKLLAAGFTSGPEVGRLARIYCLAATAIFDNEELTSAERTEQRQHSAACALRLLLDARDQGWLDDPAIQLQLRTHADFRVLQPHAEFQALLNSMSRH
jgi:tetratricopeptide (TPR) repeat protein